MKLHYQARAKGEKTPLDSRPTIDPDHSWVFEAFVAESRRRIVTMAGAMPISTEAVIARASILDLTPEEALDLDYFVAELDREFFRLRKSQESASIPQRPEMPAKEPAKRKHRVEIGRRP